MKTHTEFRYRIIYEALSLFSSKLSKCNSFETVATCLFSNMKYILDFQFLRLSFYDHDLMISYSVNSRQCNFEKSKTIKLWQQEKLFILEKAPVLSSAETALLDDLARNNIMLKQTPEDVWGWNFQIQENCGIIITLATNYDKKFTKSDVPVLKLVVENLASKLLSLKLIEELDINKNELETALESLKETNETIKRIVSKQDELIEKRTAEIKEKNRRLLEISKNNAHSVREPLSRIMGILMMIEQSEDKNEILEEGLPLLYRSSNDLNNAINSTILFVDDQITKMRKYEPENNVGG